jgi:hypothetical protein
MSVRTSPPDQATQCEATIDERDGDLIIYEISDEYSDGRWVSSDTTLNMEDWR